MPDAPPVFVDLTGRRRRRVRVAAVVAAVVAAASLLGVGALMVAALHGYGDSSVRERAMFYGRCGVLEDLAYGVKTGGEVYAHKSLVALAWLFEPGRKV